MVNLIIELSKYALIFLIAIYTCMNFVALKIKKQSRKNFMLIQMMLIMLMIHLISYVVLYLKLNQDKILYFYGAQVGYFVISGILWNLIYPRINKVLYANMSMFLMIGFVMLTRLNYDQAIRQFQITLAATVLSFFVPLIVAKGKWISRYSRIYGILGIVLLGMVWLLSGTTYGANLSISVGGILIQPSEFVKILFVFYAAGRLQGEYDLKNVLTTSVMAGVHVLILVLSKDLGSALIYFITYMVMLYIATEKASFVFLGTGAGSLAAVIAYFLFSHVRVRVKAWRDPWSCIDAEGYQVAQSLFAIGTGGWLGMGLCQGSPKSIPFVSKDSIFSAISEELGGIFAFCFILLCMSIFLVMFFQALRCRNRFYQLILMGFGTMYGFQVFLTVGGAMKFIPLTGVTLPLVSYGGSSLLSTMIIFAVVQGTHLLKEEPEEDEDMVEVDLDEEETGKEMEET